MARETILVIDADAERQQLLVDDVIAPAGYRHLEADSGAQGLRLASEARADAVILNADLPGEDGWTILKQLRRLDESLPVIFTSSDPSAEPAVRAFRLGAFDYFVAPLSAGEVRERLTQALDRSPSQAEPSETLMERLMETNRQLQRHLQELNTVYEIGRSVTSVLDLDQVLNRVVEAGVYMAEAEEGLLLLLDSQGSDLYLRAATGVEEDLGRNLRVRVADSAAGRAIRSDRPVLISGETAKISTGYLVKTLLYLPLRVPERGVIGVLGIANRRSEMEFSERDIYLLSALADYAAVAIENARLFEAMEIERAKMEAVLRGAQELIVVVDQANRVLLCNRAARTTLGLEGIDLLHKPVEEILPDETLRRMFSPPPSADPQTHAEVDLGDRTFNAQISHIENVGRVLVMQDITRLKELDQIRADFVSTVSHDLRTPLTNILGYVELMPRAGPLNDQQMDFVNRVRDSMEAITALITDLLDIGRIEADDLEKGPCDLTALVDEAVEAIQQQAEAKGQTLEWAAPEVVSPVLGNERALRQVMDNLLSNAVKYTPEGGRIEVDLRREGEHAIVRVADDGIGIPEEEQAHIFDRFYRVEDPATQDVGGTGLGLAIVKSAIERHNGRVWVESEPGEGSVFSFVLPLLDTQEEAL